MAPLPPVANTLKFNVHWQIDADTMGQTVHYFRYSGGPPTAATCAALAADFTSLAASNMDTMFSANVGINSVRAIDLASSSGAEGTGGAPWVGTRAGGQLAPATSAVISHFIARRYRGGKPRTYLPAGTSPDVAVAGLWTDAFVAAMEAAWGAFTAAFIGTAEGGTTITQIVNVSYFTGPNIPFINPMTNRASNRSTRRGVPVTDIITGHTVPKQIGSQRRRNRDA